MSSPPVKKKADLKVVIIGAASVGKTTLIHRYITGNFQDSISTIGASFSLKQWGQYNVAIWDTAGEERFTGLSSFYARGAGAAILAYDVTDVDSFHTLRARFVQLLQSAEENCLCVVVATKTDLLPGKERKVSPEDGMLLARELNRGSSELPFFETSSLGGQNVNRVFEYIFTTLLDNAATARRVKKSTSVVDLEAPSKGGIPQGQAKGGCC